MIVSNASANNDCNDEVSVNIVGHPSTLLDNYSAAVKANPRMVDSDRPTALPHTDFVTVVNKKRKNRLVVGNNSVNTRLQGVEKKSVFCVNRLKPDTTVDNVKDFLLSQGVSVFSCYGMLSDPQQRQTVLEMTPLTLYNLSRNILA